MSFWACILICLIKIFIFCAQSFNFDQTYLNTGSITQNMEELSLDLIFYNNFWWNIKSFSKQNSKLRIHSKLDRNKSKLTVCNVPQLLGSTAPRILTFNPLYSILAPRTIMELGKFTNPMYHWNWRIRTLSSLFVFFKRWNFKSGSSWWRIWSYNDSVGLSRYLYFFLQ